jgi:hypothetical protein
VRENMPVRGLGVDSYIDHHPKRATGDELAVRCRRTGGGAMVICALPFVKSAKSALFSGLNCHI